MILYFIKCAQSTDLSYIGYGDVSASFNTNRLSKRIEARLEHTLSAYVFWSNAPQVK